MPNGEVTPDSLIRAIESVQEAIRRDGRTIGANETRTRNTLIDPLLRALGWDDPSVVTQEYLVRYGAREFEYGVADYAFHPPGQRANPIAFLEAKRMKEDLTDEHRNQVFNYVLDKGGSVRQFGLTNGDRWELYELNEGEPRKKFEFSINKQSASDCADLLFSHFPMLNSLSAARSLKPADALTTIVPDAGTIPRAPEIPSIPSSRLANNVDVPKVLTWLGAFLIAFGIFGWISGVWTAQPIEGAFEYIGLFTVAIGMILAAALVRRFYPSAGPVVLNILRLKWLFAPINGNRRKTLIWVASATVFGVGVGGVGGHLIGLQTGQAVVNALETLGKVVVVTVIVVIVLLIGWEAANNSGKRRRGGWRPRSSYRKRRW